LSVSVFLGALADRLPVFGFGVVAAIGLMIGSESGSTSLLVIPCELVVPT
jgi:hypothetical protein